MEDLVASLPKQNKRNMRGCEQEFIFYMICLRDPKLGRFNVALPVITHAEEDIKAYEARNKASAILGGGGSAPLAPPSGTPGKWACDPDVRKLVRAESAKLIPIGLLGPPALIRASQSHTHFERIVPWRCFTQITLNTAQYCHSFTHLTEFANLVPILERGLKKVGRTVHLHVFPPHDPRHVQSSRSRLPLTIVMKSEATLVSTELWGKLPGPGSQF